MGLIVIALCVGCSWERASNVSEDQIQWGSETRDYLSYEEYFSQQRLYDYAEDVFSGWSLQDADISYDGTVLRLTDSKGIPMQDIATLKGYLFQTADKNWIYGISETSELVRVSYSGKIETLFADRTGLLRSLAEKEHAPIYLADGCTLFFLAGTDEGIGIYRLYLPNKQADVLYSSIPRNALRLRLEPPPSNVEAVWDNGDVLFFARYEELLNTSSGYAPETMGEDECIGMLELDEKLYSAQAHYINALTGDYREMPYGYVYGWPLNDNYALAYRVLQSVCGIQRGSQPYSHMKKAELVLKGYVSESSSTQLTSLNIAINGGLAMGHYWKGRLLLEQAKQDHDRCNDYKDAAIASFCATNVTERFDHLPENADEDAAPQLSPPQWLSAIELLRYPDRAVFRVDRRMVFQTIYQKLTQQVEEVQSDNIQIHNERYRLTKKDVRSNLERCLDMVKAQFPDKEPLIQKMIRSIR